MTMFQIRGLFNHLVALASFQLVAASCATVNPVVAETINTETGRFERRLPTQRMLLQATVDGTELHFDSQPACDLVGFSSMLETKRIEHDVDGIEYDVLAGVLATAAIGVGVGFVVDASDVGSSSTDARVYNRYGPRTPTIVGYASIAGGLALLSIPIVDIIRASRTDYEERGFETEGAALARDVVCQDGGPRTVPDGWVAVPAAPMTLGIATRGGSQTLTFSANFVPGRTLNVDLVSVVDGEKLAAGERRASHLEVVLDRVPIITVPADSALAAIDLQRRRGLAGAMKACDNPVAADSCDSIVTEVSKFPATSYVAELRALLLKSEPALAASRDANAWAAAGMERCLAPDDENDCDAVDRYVKEWPQGRFAAEARKALSRGQQKIRSLLAQREADERRKAAEERAEEARARAEANNPCSRILGYQQGEAYSCRTIISGCRKAGGSQFWRGCVTDLMGNACNSCF